jgi:hypothetical protein
LPPCGKSSRLVVINIAIKLKCRRTMHDADGPRVTKWFYERLFAEDMITLDAIPYALEYAIGELRKSGAPPERWATFIHMGA